MQWILRAMVVAALALAVRSVAIWFVEAERERAELLGTAARREISQAR